MEESILVDPGGITVTEKDVARFYRERHGLRAVYYDLRDLARRDKRNTLIRYQGRTEKAIQYTYYITHSVRDLALLLRLPKSTLADYLKTFIKDGFLIRETRTAYPQGELPDNDAYYFRVTLFLLSSKKFLIWTLPGQVSDKNSDADKRKNRERIQIEDAWQRKIAGQFSVAKPDVSLTSYLRKSSYTKDRLSNADPVKKARWRALLINLVGFGFDPALINAAWMWLEIAGQEHGFQVGDDALFYFCDHVLEVCDAMLQWSGTNGRRGQATGGGRQGQLVLDTPVEQFKPEIGLETPNGLELDPDPSELI
jgi:DNA-binding MarR family transcriptional regulator